MRALASFVMRGPGQAVLVAGGFAALSLLLPPLSYLSAATVALITLRQGAKNGLLVAGAATLAVAVLMGVSVGQPGFGASIALLLWLPVWALGLVLRATVSLASVFKVAAVGGGLLVVTLHLVLADPAQTWRHMLDGYFGAVLREAGVADVDALIGALAAMMTGFAAAAMVVSYLISLFIGRWWQSLLYNPGGFREEFHTLRLGQGMALAAIVLLVLGWLGPAGLGTLARDLGAVMLIVYLFQGLAIIHGVVGLLNASSGWLVGLYIVAGFALPQLTLVLAIMGLIDTWTDIRARLAVRGGPGTR